MIEDYVILYERDASCVRLRPDAWSLVDAAMTLYIGEGRSFALVDGESQRDSIIRVTTLCGEPYCVLASAVTSWRYITRETRQRGTEIDTELVVEQATDASAVEARTAATADAAS